LEINKTVQQDIIMKLLDLIKESTERPFVFIENNKAVPLNIVQKIKMELGIVILHKDNKTFVAKKDVRFYDAVSELEDKDIPIGNVYFVNKNKTGIYVRMTSMAQEDGEYIGSFVFVIPFDKSQFTV